MSVFYQQAYSLPPLAGATQTHSAGPAAAPTAFAAGTPTDSAVPLMWAGPTGATFVVQRATNSSFTAGLATIYTGTNLSVTNSSGLSASTTYYFRVKTKLTGFTDSAYVSTSATTTGQGVDVVIPTHQSNDSGLSNRNELAPADVAEIDANTQVLTLDKVAGTLVPYRLGTTDPGTGYPVGATDKAITKELLPAFDNGFGPDVYFVLAWLRDPANAGKKLVVFKKDLLHPLSSTNGASIAAWLDGTNNFPPIYDAFLAEWQQQQAALQAMGYTLANRLWIDGGGEQDSDEGNAAYQASLERFYQRLLSDGILTPQSKVLIAKKQRDLTYHPFDATIAAAQAAFVNAHPSVAKLIDLRFPTFMDSTHYTAESMKRLGTVEYRNYAGPVVALPTNWANLTFTTKAPDFVSDNAGNWRTTATDGSWGHGGKSDLTLPAYGNGGICMHYTSAAGAAGVCGLHDAAGLVSIQGMRFSFYVEPTGTLSIFYTPVGNSTPTPVSTGTAAPYGYYWIGRFDGAICILYSTDQATWTLAYRFSAAYDTDAQLYPMVDVNSGDPTFGLQQPQGAGLS